MQVLAVLRRCFKLAYSEVLFDSFFNFNFVYFWSQLTDNIRWWKEFKMRLETSLSQPYDFYISFPLRQRLLHKVHKQLMLALLRAST